MVLRHDFYGAKSAVGSEICGFIGERILAAQFVLDFGEGIRDITDLEGEEGTPPGRGRNALQHLVSSFFHAADVGADGVDDHFGALRHFDSLLARDMALVVIAVAQQDDGASHWPRLGRFPQLVAAGEV